MPRLLTTTYHLHLKTVLFSLLAASITGCATVNEAAKCVAGTSTKVLEDNRKSAVKAALKYDLKTAYDKTREYLEKEGAYIYSEDKAKMLAIYLSEEDTTPVGLFFKEMPDGRTLVEVSSPSTYAKELIAGKIVGGFEEKGKGDAQK